MQRLADYVCARSEFDELCQKDSSIRPHWQDLVRTLDAMGAEGLERRRTVIDRLLLEHGVTFNLYGEPGGLDRPWPFDALPLILPGPEWETLRRGLAQRVELLNAVLADLYGPRKLLDSGMVPAEAIWSDPAFLRPMAGTPLVEGIHIHFYAADLARDGEGRWTVVADRTQAPSGAGYALENRIVLRRAWPEIMRTLEVRRLGGFYAAYREGIGRLAAWTDRPRIVLWTPGPFNETYFEHAFLARQLGINLVEGSDLIAREDALWLKTASGLERIDVVMRRVDAAFCDPLELRPDSALGVPGLVEVLRSGRLVMANALGAALAENKAIAAALPGIARAWRGEELAVPTAPPGVTLSHMPTTLAAGYEPRPMVLRMFVARTPTGYQVMPGGFVRTAPDGEVERVSLQRGGVTKDCWIVGRDPDDAGVEADSPAGDIVTLATGDDLPSRAADNLFWLGRYVERATAALRLAQAALARAAARADANWIEPVARAMARRGWLGVERDRAAIEAAVLAAYVEPSVDPATALAAVRRLVRYVRNRLSPAAWALARRVEDLDRRGAPHGALEGGENAAALVVALDGLASAIVAEVGSDGGARFFDLGRRIEHAQAGCDRLATLLGRRIAAEIEALELILELDQARTPYRARYLGTPQIAPLLHLSLVDDGAANSLARDVAAIAEHVQALARFGRSRRPGPVRRALRALERILAEVDLVALGRADAQGVRTGLTEFLQRVGAELAALSDALSRRYFVQALPATHLAQERRAHA